MGETFQAASPQQQWAEGSGSEIPPPSETGPRAACGVGGAAPGQPGELV